MLAVQLAVMFVKVERACPLIMVGMYPWIEALILSDGSAIKMLPFCDAKLVYRHHAMASCCTGITWCQAGVQASRDGQLLCRRACDGKLLCGRACDGKLLCKHCISPMLQHRLALALSKLAQVEAARWCAGSRECGLICVLVSVSASWASEACRRESKCVDVKRNVDRKLIECVLCNSSRRMV